ncbi:MAG: TetR/AcrR family transcriptional regulator [Clostridia bacterium]|nr:TetR/AcrR family transcriptional regulator [Clostridia bacterium]
MANVSNEESKKFTKECVISALKSLLKEKTYKDITLTEIAEKAGVSRNAIYRNFETKDKILKKYLDEITYDFMLHVENLNISSHEEYVRILFYHLCSHKDIAKIIVDSGLSNILLESFMLMKGLYDVEHSIKDYYENFRIGGMFFIYLTWIENGCKESADKLVEIVNKVLATESIIPYR